MARHNRAWREAMQRNAENARFAFPACNPCEPIEIPWLAGDDAMLAELPSAIREAWQDATSDAAD